MDSLATRKDFTLATPIDRVAAILTDTIILTILTSLLLSPIRRQVMLAQITDEVPSYFMWIFLGAGVFCLTAILYQTLFIWWKGATPGKLLFQIRVISIWQKKITFHTALIRTITWWMSSLAFFIPHLSVLSNRQRRPIHDRLADTIVISIGRRKAGAPSVTELLLVRSVHAFLFGTLVLFVLWETVYQFQSLAWQEYLSDAEHSDQICLSVSDAMEVWPLEDNKEPSRLSVALALYTVENIDEECLDVEAERAFREGSNLELAYLARSFVHTDDADISDQYLEKVCDENKNSDACLLSRIVEYWSEQDWEASSNLLGILPKSTKVFLKLWAVKHYERIKQFAKEQEIIESLWPNPAIASFIGVHRVVSLWGLYERNSARLAFDMFAENAEPDRVLSLAQWLCFQETENQCGQNFETPHSCHLFSQMVESDPQILINDAIATTYVRQHNCHGDASSKDFLNQIIASSEVKRLVEAQRLTQENKVDQAMQILRKMATNKELDESISYEAEVQLLSLTNSTEDINAIVDRWQKRDTTTWTWRNLGRHIVSRLTARDDLNRAFQITQAMLSVDRYNFDMHKQYVVLSYRMGEYKRAWQKLDSHSQSRTPASEEEYELYKSKLKSMFGDK
jgi:uncharacterized RDD family membrane protein YckC